MEGEGFGIFTYTGLVTPEHATCDGGGKDGRCSSKPQAEVAAAEGLCYTQGGKDFSPSLFPALLSCPTLGKNVSGSGKQASATCEEAKATRT